MRIQEHRKAKLYDEPNLCVWTTHTAETIPASVLERIMLAGLLSVTHPSSHPKFRKTCTVWVRLATTAKRDYNSIVSTPQLMCNFIAILANLKPATNPYLNHHEAQQHLAQHLTSAVARAGRHLSKLKVHRKAKRKR